MEHRRSVPGAGVGTRFAHGRAHAPCDTSDYDTRYPYDGGGIGSWGYGIESKQFYNPNNYADFMGYCQDTWVSDYTFGKLRERMASVNATVSNLRVAGNETKTYRVVNIAEDGSASWGDTMPLRHTPTNEPHAVQVTLADGTTSTVTGHYYPYSHLEGGYVLVPEGTGIRALSMTLNSTLPIRL